MRYALVVAIMFFAVFISACGTREQWLRGSQGFLDGTQQGLAAQHPLYLPPTRGPRF